MIVSRASCFLGHWYKMAPASDFWIISKSLAKKTSEMSENTIIFLQRSLNFFRRQLQNVEELQVKDNLHFQQPPFSNSFCSHSRFRTENISRRAGETQSILLAKLLFDSIAHLESEKNEFLGHVMLKV